MSEMMETFPIAVIEEGNSSKHSFTGFSSHDDFLAEDREHVINTIWNLHTGFFSLPETKTALSFSRTQIHIDLELINRTIINEPFHELQRFKDKGASTRIILSQLKSMEEGIIFLFFFIKK